MNSLMSMRMRCSSESNRKLASDLHSSVLPTPVGTRNRKEPYGRFGSDRPERERRMASDTRRTASSCPTTRSCSLSSMCSGLYAPPAISLAPGNAGRAAHHFGDLFRADLRAQQFVLLRAALGLALCSLFQLGFELRQ